MSKSALCCNYNIEHISQVQIFYRVTWSPNIAAGDETVEVALFDWEEILAELAFPSVYWALKYFLKHGKWIVCLRPAGRLAPDTGFNYTG